MAKQHSLFCDCNRCRKAKYPFTYAAEQEKKRKKSSGGSNFSKTRPDGTTIYGSTSDKRPGHKHGHKGKDFDRTPHSSVGSAAIGRLHDEQKHKDDMTHRW